VPERVVPVIMVEVSVATEHLLNDGLDVGEVVRGKAGALADPVVVEACKSVEGGSEVGRAGGDGCG